MDCTTPLLPVGLGDGVVGSWLGDCQIQVLYIQKFVDRRYKHFLRSNRLLYIAFVDCLLVAWRLACGNIYLVATSSVDLTGLIVDDIIRRTCDSELT
jgi:hypothetical protein